MTTLGHGLMESYELEPNVKSISIDDINFSCRVHHCLIKADIHTVKDILMLTSEEILSMRYLNKTSIKEIMERLKRLEVPISEMLHLREAYGNYYEYIKECDNNYKKIRNKIFQISLVEHMEFIEQLYKDKVFKNENEQASCEFIIKELGFNTIEEFEKYEFSEESIILFLNRLIIETQENRITWKSKQKYIFQTEDIRVFYAGKSLLSLNVLERTLLFCDSIVTKASNGKIINDKIKELYNLLDKKVRVVGRKDLEFYNWDMGDFEYPDWHSRAKICIIDDLDEAFDAFLEEQENCFNEKSNDKKYFVAKFYDGKEKWLSWSHWGDNIEEGFYYVPNEERAAIFTEDTLRCEAVVKHLQIKDFTIYQIDEKKAKRYRGRIFQE